MIKNNQHYTSELDDSQCDGASFAISGLDHRLITIILYIIIIIMIFILLQ